MKSVGRFLIVNPLAVVRAGLSAVARAAAPEREVTEVDTWDEAVEASNGGPWRLIVIDPLSVEGDGIALVRRLRATSPGAAIIVYSNAPEANVGLAAITAGANGFLSSRAPIAELDAVLMRLQPTPFSLAQTSRRCGESSLSETC